MSYKMLLALQPDCKLHHKISLIVGLSCRAGQLDVAAAPGKPSLRSEPVMADELCEYK